MEIFIGSLTTIVGIILGGYITYKLQIFQQSGMTRDNRLWELRCALYNNISNDLTRFSLIAVAMPGATLAESLAAMLHEHEAFWYEQAGTFYLLCSREYREKYIELYDKVKEAQHQGLEEQDRQEMLKTANELLVRAREGMQENKEI